MKIAVFGLGYVGLSNAVLLAQHHQVTAFDIDIDKVRLINQRKSPIVDAEIEDFFANQKLNLKATNCKQEAIEDAAYVLIATPTDYDVATNYFNTSSVQAVINDVLTANADTVMIFKSTVPVGYTENIK